MLSEAEYYTALQKLNNISSDIHRKHQQNYKQLLKKQIKEYEYKLKYEHFEPLPHIPYFINKITTEQTLHQLIQAATSSSEFIIDTESINIHKQKNKPALVQIQILLPYNLSLVMIVEMCHLPGDNTTRFTLIKQLFDLIITSNKQLYIWGTKDELFPFINFKLFSHEQLQSITPINLQHQFKLFWNEQHPHYDRISTLSNEAEDKCVCEKCIGKKSSEPWSLQDSIAYLLNEYLPKILTKEKFNIGLDPNLFDLDFSEKQYRQQLTTYALNDCLSMQRILIHMKNEKIEFKFNSKKHIEPKLFQLSPISSDEDDDLLYTQRTSSLYTHQKKFSNHIIFSNKPSTPSIVTLEDKFPLSTRIDLPMSHQPELMPSFNDLQRYSHDWESIRTNENDINLPDWTNAQSTLNRDNQDESTNPREKLSDDQRKKMHNRSCTIKQRKRYYRNELIFKNIDHRFSIKQIKMIFQQQQIPFYIVNTKTTTTNKRTLFVAIRNPESINIYEQQSRDLFTTTHYEKLKTNGQLPRANRRSNSHHQQSQSRSRHSHH
ncbi:unnamed protein product [Rotaria sordida]|uniref:Uncharacterized protein n=2 Tax=Rotaria sordida TaxID=392033 RepID=A0A815TMA9_9BILA|nr:unnamed protein product [Rotaria sordida]CAF1657356.1 unnamed protein product [Rotaria sordida]